MRLIQANGFPSSSRQLVWKPRRRNTNDPNDYYKVLGVPPWASPDEIKKAYWRLAKIVHPDGSEPDEDAFRYLQAIYEVLSDPIQKELYDSTPRGFFYVAEFEKELIISSDGEYTTVSAESVLPPKLPSPPPFKHWDYYVDSDEDLRERAQVWYSLLIQEAHFRGYEDTIRIGFLSGLDDTFPHFKLVPLSGAIVCLLSPTLEPATYRAVLLLNRLEDTLWASKKPYILSRDNG